jgi:hypothetical protein
VLVEPGGDALFVLTSAPTAGYVYQAWGHVRDDWEPGSDAQLTSLGTSSEAVFSVAPEGFAALYLSLEPDGGSVQPTEALAHVPLTTPPATAPLEILAPQNGATVSTDRVIVQGRVISTPSRLYYRLNDDQAVATPVAGLNFTFTVSGLRLGANTLEVNAIIGNTTVEARLTLFYEP